MKKTKNGQQRSNLRRALAIAWVKSTRPDVMAVIEAELDKRFPAGKTYVPVRLPASLEKISK